MCTNCNDCSGVIVPRAAAEGFIEKIAFELSPKAYLETLSEGEGKTKEGKLLMDKTLHVKSHKVSFIGYNWMDVYCVAFSSGFGV